MIALLVYWTGFALLVLAYTGIRILEGIFWLMLATTLLLTSYVFALVIAFKKQRARHG